MRVGGIIGEIGNSNISVEGNSYNGDLSGSPANAMYKGGIIGKITGENVPSISDNMYVGAAFGIGYDAGGDASDNPGCLNLANLTIEITKESLPSGTIDKSYRTTLSAKVTGGDFPVTWSKTSGTLPPGLTLSTSGVISGIPIEADTYTFTVTAKLGENGIKTASKEYTITITDGNQPTYSLTVKNTSLADGTVGKSYSETLKAELTGAELPAATWSYTGTLPPGIKLNTDGTITDKPTTAGTYTFTVTAVFGAFTGSKTFTVTIASAGSSIETPEYEPKPEFKTQSLLLSGQIGLNFYMDLPSISGVNYMDSECYMEFDVDGDTASNNPQPYDPEFMNAKKTYYGFRCYLNSVQMADSVTSTFHYGNGKTVTKTYSAKQYIDTVLGRDDFSAEVKNLMSAMKDYGHYMQIFLSQSRGWTIGVDHTEMECANVYTDADIAEATEEAANYRAVYDVNGSGIQKLTYSLVLDSETALNIYLTPTPAFKESIETPEAGDATEGVYAYLDGGNANLAVLQPDGRYRVQISGIAAHQLGDTYTITVHAGGTFDVKISALSYVNAVLSSSAFGTDAKNGVTSLYRYYTTAIAYRDSTSK